MICFFVRGNGRSVHAFGIPTERLARFSAFAPGALKPEGWQLSPIWSGAGAEFRS
jgi:hypothetical protein